MRLFLFVFWLFSITPKRLLKKTTDFGSLYNLKYFKADSPVPRIKTNRFVWTCMWKWWKLFSMKIYVSWKWFCDHLVYWREYVQDLYLLQRQELCTHLAITCVWYEPLVTNCWFGVFVWLVFVGFLFGFLLLLAFFHFTCKAWSHISHLNGADNFCPPISSMAGWVGFQVFGQFHARMWSSNLCFSEWRNYFICTFCSEKTGLSKNILLTG